MTRRAQKHKDWTLAQWPEDLSNTDLLSTPYECHACRKPCKSIRSLRTHDCKAHRKKVAANAH